MRMRRFIKSVGGTLLAAAIAFTGDISAVPVFAAEVLESDADAAGSVAGEVLVPEDTVAEEALEETLVPEETAGISDEVYGNGTVTYEVPGGKLYFDPETGTITWATGDMEELTIPEEINGTKVRLIKRWGLSGLKKVKKLNLPQSTTILGEGSLAELVSLEEFTIPGVYDSIPKQCFYGCTALRKVSMPASITSIGEMAFYECSSLEYADIPGNCMSLGKMAFYSCTGLKGVAFAQGSACDLSGWGIFYNCMSLDKVVNIPNQRFKTFYESGKRAEKWLTTDEMIRNQSEMWRLRFPTQSERESGVKSVDAAEQRRREDAIRAKAQAVTSGCTTDREKIEAVMKWITANLEYELGHDNHPWAVFTGIQQVEAGQKSAQLNSCGGYSNMTQVMLQSLGIPCATVWRQDRNGETIDHEFCAAYYDGKWRWLDTTHSDNRKEGLELDVKTAAFFYDSDHRVDYLLYRSGQNGDNDIYKELPLDIAVEPDVKDWPNQNPDDAYTAGEAAQDPDWVHAVDPAVVQAEKDKIAQRNAEFPNIPVSSESIFEFNGATGTITGLKATTETRINIPATIGGVTVRAIGDSAFQNRSLEYVTMPDTITSIGKYAFADNGNLKRLHLSAAVTELKEGICQNCRSLDSITIPASVKRLDKSLFRNCGSLEEALFEDYDFKIRVIETDPMGSDNNYDSGQADISWYCFAGMSGRALHGLDFHETYIGTKYYRQLQAVQLTDNWRQNIVNIHQSQRGYREGFSPYHLDGSNSKEFKLSGKAVDYEWGHFAEASRFTGYQPATWCRAFIDWAYAMAGVSGYRSTEYQWADTVYAGGTVTLEPGDMLGMGKSHWCMVGSVKELEDSIEIWIIHGNHSDRKVMDEVRHYNKQTGIATDMEDDDYNYFRAIYKIDFSGVKTRTVTLDPGDGTCDVKSRIYCEGAYYGCLPDAVKTDCVFDGWYTQPEGGLRAYPYRKLGADVTTLYAHYTYDPNAVKGITLDKDNVSIRPGAQLTLNATVLPANAANRSVSWRSGNDEVVSVSGGVIKGLKEGKATILARTDGGPYVAYCEVEVSENAPATDSPSSPEAANSVEAFVTRMYAIMLGRAGDRAGIDDWTNQLITKKSTGAGVAQGFVLSDELKGQNISDEEFILRLYRTFFNSDGDDAGKAYWLGELKKGHSRKYVFRGFAESKQFSELCGSFGIERGNVTLTEKDLECSDDNLHIDREKVEQYIDRLYMTILGRGGDPAGRQYWIDRIMNREENAASVAKRGFFHSEEYLKANKSNTDFAKDLYRSMMGREADANGLAYWEEQLITGAYDRDRMIEHGFGNSKEFKEILQSFGLKKLD